jgi:hypothetical protein
VLGAEERFEVEELVFDCCVGSSRHRRWRWGVRAG